MLRARVLVVVAAVAAGTIIGCKAEEKQEPTESVRPVVRDAGLDDALRTLALGGVSGKWYRGAAIAVIRRGAAPIYVFVGDDGRGAALSEHTIFEVGSVSKVFTGLLLAEAVVRGEVALEDPVASSTRMATPVDWSQVPTLEQLSKHTSGLPRLPTGFEPADMANPYADFDRAKLAAYLKTARLESVPGQRYQYSNLGAGLLGAILAERASTTYGALLRERISAPLGLRDTGVVVAEKDAKRVAVGHNGLLGVASPWTVGALAGAFAIRSSPADMSTFLAYQMSPPESQRESIGMTHKLSDAGGQKLGLGWHSGADGILWHNGQTGGFSSFAAIDPKAGVAVLVLANTTTTLVDGLGAAVLATARGRDTDFKWP